VAIAKVIKTIERHMFYKSMTTHADHRVWRPARISQQPGGASRQTGVPIRPSQRAAASRRTAQRISKKLAPHKTETILQGGWFLSCRKM